MLVNHVAVTTKDMGRCIAFYRDALGLNVFRDFIMNGQDLEMSVMEPLPELRVVLVADDAGFIIELLDWVRPPVSERPPQHLRFTSTGLCELCFETSDLERLRKSLESYDFRFRTPIWVLEMDDGVKLRVAHALDPDGVQVKLVQRVGGEGDFSARGKQVSITTKNVEESLAFYRDALGLKVTGDCIFKGPDFERAVMEPLAECRVITFTDEAGRAIELLDWVRPTARERPSEHLKYTSTGLSEVCFQTSDLEGAGKNLEKYGFKFRTPTWIFEAPEGVKLEVTHASNPDGIQVELFQLLEG